jgi:hypothetical protein
MPKVELRAKIKKDTPSDLYEKNSSVKHWDNHGINIISDDGLMAVVIGPAPLKINYLY